VIADFEVASRISIPAFQFSAQTLADPIATYLGAYGMLPDHKYADSRKQVLRFLEEAMDDVFGDEEWKMELIGSSRLGVDVDGSDLDIVVIGHMPRGQFFDYSVKVLSVQGCVADLRAVLDTVVPVVKLAVGGIHVFALLSRCFHVLSLTLTQIDIQYCCMPYTELPKRCVDINNLTLLKLDKPSLVAVNGINLILVFSFCFGYLTSNRSNRFRIDRSSRSRYGHFSLACIVHQIVGQKYAIHSNDYKK